MSAEEFLLGFRRFISTRGSPNEITSDNAKQFKTASQVLDVLWKNVTKCDEVQNYASNIGVKWTFIVELAPWMGGFYERMVGVVKRALKINQPKVTIVCSVANCYQGSRSSCKCTTSCVCRRGY